MLFTWILGSICTAQLKLSENREVITLNQDQLLNTENVPAPTSFHVNVSFQVMR